MKKIIIALFTALCVTGSVIAQNADPIVNVVANPGILDEQATGLLQVTASNIGNTSIINNSLQVTITIGANATITGLAASSSTKWTTSSFTTGNGNTITMRNTAGIIQPFDTATILLAVQAKESENAGNITATIGYIPGPNVLLPGSAPSSTQGNAQTNNDISLSSLVVNNVVPLPVKLLSFSGRGNKCNALISWETGQENTADYYEVERSTDGSHFAAKAKAAGGQSTYSVSIPQDAAKTFYRLKMGDGSGTVSYSNTIVVTTSCGSGPVTAYPNPTSSSLTITGLSGGETIRFYNVLGQVVKNTVANGSPFTEDLSNLPAGQYRAVISNQEITVITIPVTKTD